MANPNQFAAEIPVALAQAAFAGTSFVPEKRAESWRAAYGAEMASDYELFQGHAIKGGTAWLRTLNAEVERQLNAIVHLGRAVA